ncbi:MAG TPA: heme exporter protein CcmB, partial [Flexilinea sp.]|nr:heme exporter protein CcmB [Flexilinea sp.]
MKSTFQTIRALIRKDMQIESHTREIFTVMLVFALSILFILNFALEQNVKVRTGSAAGLIWIILILAGQLGLNQIMGIEKQGNMIEALLASPVPRSAIYLSKTIS